MLPILILREILLDYNNSLTIFIRGHPKITERLKEEGGILQIPLQEQVGVRNQKICITYHLNFPFLNLPFYAYQLINFKLKKSHECVYRER